MRVSLVLALVAVVVAVCASVQSASAHGVSNPLELLDISGLVDVTASAPAAASIHIELPAAHNGKIKGKGESLKVVWSGMPADCGSGCWIGVYNPRPADFAKSLPNKYWQLGAKQAQQGHKMVWFLNQRTEVMVAFFRGGLKSPVLVAVSESVAFESYALPMQVHLAFTDDPTQMRVLWTSNSSAATNPRVRWGLMEQPFTGQAAAETLTYSAKDMCGIQAVGAGYRDPGQLHQALMQHLQPGQHYWYAVGDDIAMAEAQSFYAAPPRGGANGGKLADVDFFVFGDLGQAEPDVTREQSGDWHTTRDTIHSMQRDINEGVVDPSRGVVMHIGDISYARGYASVWEQFFYTISNISQSMPWMTAVGNHERDYPKSGSLYEGPDSGGECGVPYNYRLNWGMPHLNPAKMDESYWSFSHGPVHWVILSTELEFKVGSAQHDFVTADLAKVDRKVTPFVILAGHRPMVAFMMMDSVAAALREAYEPLIIKHKVDLSLWGHQHVYQRSCPVAFTTGHEVKCASEGDGTGTIHIVTGAPGAPMSPVDPSKKPDWAQFVESKTHGYSRGSVREGGTVLTLQYVYNSDPRQIIDQVVIKSKFANGVYIGNGNNATAVAAAAVAADDKEEQLVMPSLVRTPARRRHMQPKLA